MTDNRRDMDSDPLLVAPAGLAACNGCGALPRLRYDQNWMLLLSHMGVGEPGCAFAHVEVFQGAGPADLPDNVRVGNEWNALMGSKGYAF
jgi:hypothetical protein